jgi:hypothetical protein
MHGLPVQEGESWFGHQRFGHWCRHHDVVKRGTGLGKRVVGDRRVITAGFGEGSPRNRTYVVAWLIGLPAAPL